MEQQNSDQGEVEEQREVQEQLVDIQLDRDLELLAQIIENEYAGRLEQLQDLFDIFQADAGELNKGLSPGRIRRFEHFTAGESIVGEQCIVCLDDLQVGMDMVRLDCHVSHCFCKKCTDAWFKDHNKCLLCNQEFS